MKTMMLAAGACAALCACGSVPEPWGPTPFDQATPAPQRMALADDALPEKVRVYRSQSGAAAAMNGVPYPQAGTATGAAGGILAGLIIAGVESGIDGRRNTLLNEAYPGIDALEARLARRVADGLAARGVALEDGAARGEKRAMLTEGLDARAHLDIVGHAVGYTQDFGQRGWRPYGQFTVRVVQGGDSPRVLFEDRVVYNQVAWTWDAVTLAPDTEHYFETFDDLTGDPQGAAAGLDAMVADVADAVVALLTDTGRPVQAAEPAPEEPADAFAPLTPFEES